MPHQPTSNLLTFLSVASLLASPATSRPTEPADEILKIDSFSILEGERLPKTVSSFTADSLPLPITFESEIFGEFPIINLESPLHSDLSAFLLGQPLPSTTGGGGSGGGGALFPNPSTSPDDSTIVPVPDALIAGGIDSICPGQDRYAFCCSLGICTYTMSCNQGEDLQCCTNEGGIPRGAGVYPDCGEAYALPSGYKGFRPDNDDLGLNAGDELVPPEESLKNI